MNLDQADKALRAHPTPVKAIYGTGDGIRARGVLVGYSDAPSGIIRLPNGANEHWRLSLIELDDDPTPAIDATDDRAAIAERALEQAEARVDQLTDQLALRSAALDRTAATNDRMRARLARVDAAIRLIAPEHITPHGARIIRRALEETK